jgi:hypothetical protein
MAFLGRNILYSLWVLVVVGIVGSLAFNYTSPKHITYPKNELLLARIDIYVDGESVNLNSTQTDFTQNACDAKDLKSHPISFYSGYKNLAFINWGNTTGRTVLKNYGFQNQGPFRGFLGVRLDKFPQINPVPIESDIIKEPNIPYNIYVYTGNSTAFIKRNSDDFLAHNLKDFLFNNLQSNSTFNLNTFAQDSSSSKPIILNNSLSEEIIVEDELKIDSKFGGNMLVFVQNSQPTNELVSAKFLDFSDSIQNPCK